LYLSLEDDLFNSYLAPEAGWCHLALLLVASETVVIEVGAFTGITPSAIRMSAVTSPLDRPTPAIVDAPVKDIPLDPVKPPLIEAPPVVTVRAPSTRSGIFDVNSVEEIVALLTNEPAVSSSSVRVVPPS
jgi:hypothetical protein